MAVPDGEGKPYPVNQTNSGPGTFVAGPNFGKIEMVDGKTKAVLDKISQEAPKLGGLLKQALRDGIISPDVAVSLSAAAHSINHDVAASLWEASRKIDHDVASSLWEASRNIDHEVAASVLEASRSINSSVAQEMLNAASVLKGVSEELREVAVEMRSAGDEIRSLSEALVSVSHFDGPTSAILEASEKLALVSNQVVPPRRSGRFLVGFFVGVAMVVAAMAFYAFKVGGT